MFALQAALCFVAWVGYGALLARRGRALLADANQLNRSQRLAKGVIALIVGVVGLFGGVGLVYTFHGLNATGMSPWAFFVITMSGIGLVHCQTLATAIFASLAREARVTESPSPTSTSSSSE